MQNQTKKGNVELVPFMTKRDILDILEYEKLTGYYFNGMPSEKFIDALSDRMRLPVEGALIHNGVEMRAFINAGKGMNARVDMPFKTFFSLPAFDTAMGKVVHIPHPKNMPIDPPRKGLSVVCSLQKADILKLGQRKNTSVAVGGIGEAVPPTLDEAVNDLVTGIDLSTVAMVSLNGLVSTSSVPIPSHDPRWYLAVEIPLEDYFALPNRIEPWPGWGWLTDEADESEAAA